MPEVGSQIASFGAVIGHRRIRRLLSQAIARETLPPTLLFAGPAGVGKWETARAVAAALNCEAPQSWADLPLDACGRCRACDRVSRGVHVDVLAIAPDERDTIRIDVIREALDRTAFRPFEGRRRAVILRDAESLQPAAQHALLKSLEEPPPATVFILTTAVASALLPTVRSRCMQLTFARLSDEEVMQVLITGQDVAPELARESAALADGSVERALALSSARAQVLGQTALQVLQRAAKSTAVSARLQSAATLYPGAGRQERPRGELAELLRTTASMLRDMELLAATPHSAALINQPFAEDLRALARAYAGERATTAFAAVNRALDALQRNVGAKVVAEWLVVQL